MPASLDPTVLTSTLRSEGELLGARDGALISIASDVPFDVAPAVDGSVVFVEQDRSVARHHGEQFELREQLVAPAPENRGVILSPNGQAGVTVGFTEICATDSCEDTLEALRQFSPSGEGPALLAAWWRVVHVYDDGTALVDAAIAEGTFEGAGEPPGPTLLLLGPDGQIRAQWEHDPRLWAREPVVLADGRVLLALEHFQVDGQLLIVDAAATAISEVAEVDLGIYDVDRLAIDGLGERVAIVLSGTGGVIWGTLP